MTEFKINYKSSVTFYIYIPLIITSHIFIWLFFKITKLENGIYIYIYIYQTHGKLCLVEHKMKHKSEINDLYPIC